MIKLVTCGIVCFKLFLHHLLLYFCKLCSEACASALCLRTRLGELQFARQVGTFICCTRAPADHREHRPGLGNNLPEPELCPRLARRDSKQTEYRSPETLSRPLIGQHGLMLASDWLMRADPERVPTSETEI